MADAFVSIPNEATDALRELTNPDEMIALPKVGAGTRAEVTATLRGLGGNDRE